MKATSSTLAAPDSLLRERSGFAVASELIKARLTLLVVLTTVVGFYLGSGGTTDYALLLNASLGTALLASGAAVLNQLIERELDARMKRTADRPIPTGRISPTTALMIGAGLSVTGLSWLLLAVNPLTALLGAATWFTYVAVYTPLKRTTVLNTLVGAIPGALPPLMGWTAATGSISAPGWALFGVLFFWQLPHFMAISWLYRDEYARAGFRMLSGVDPDGHRTAASAVRNTVALLVVSLFPFMFGIVGAVYLTGAILLGVGFLVFAIVFARALTARAARRLFFASILYLPLLLGLLVVDKRPAPLTSRDLSRQYSPASAAPGSLPSTASNF